MLLIPTSIYECWYPSSGWSPCLKVIDTAFPLYFWAPSLPWTKRGLLLAFLSAVVTMCTVGIHISKTHAQERQAESKYWESRSYFKIGSNISPNATCFQVPSSESSCWNGDKPPGMPLWPVRLYRANQPVHYEEHDLVLYVFLFYYWKKKQKKMRLVLTILSNRGKTDRHHFLHMTASCLYHLKWVPRYHSVDDTNISQCTLTEWPPDKQHHSKLSQARTAWNASWCYHYSDDYPQHSQTLWVFTWNMAKAIVSASMSVERWLCVMSSSCSPCWWNWFFSLTFTHILRISYPLGLSKQSTGIAYLK